MHISEFNKLKKEKKKTRTYYDRYNDAVSKGFSFKKDDIYVLKNDSIVIEFNDVILLSLNDLLRIHEKKAYKYKCLWKERVINILEKNNYNINTPITIEILYINRKNKKLDYDASIACTKYIIDGLVKAKLIEDDTQEHIPLILSNTIINKDAEYDSVILCIKSIGDINNYYSEDFKSIIKNKAP